jgi:hypothetical protein
MRKTVAVLVVLLITLMMATPVMAQDNVPVVAVSAIGTVLSTVLGIVVSLVLEFYPPAAKWWNEFEYQRQTFIGMGVLLAVILIGLNAIGAVQMELPEPFWWNGFWAWFIQVVTWATSFIGAGQTTYTATRKTSYRSTLEE